ncbi:MAG: glycosyltransferase family 2 protein [Magnetococcus sp. WYHC-3]
MTDTGPSMRLAVIVPAYNEHASITATVSGLRALQPTLETLGLGLWIIVIDDGSSDDTASLAREAGADRVVRHRRNSGLGAAVRSGLRAAHQDDADIVVKFDADLQHRPEDIPELVQPILDDSADVVYGNRFQRIEYTMPVVRRWGNVVFTRLMGWLTGWPLKDGQPGIFAINRDYLSQFYLPGDYNYTQQILIDAYRKGMRFAHVPVTFRPRRTGRSFISLKYPFKVLPQIFMVLVAVRPLKIFGPMGMVFLLLGLGIGVTELIQWFLGLSYKPVLHVNLVLGLTLFGLQTLFFGVLAHLIVDVRNGR